MKMTRRKGYQEVEQHSNILHLYTYLYIALWATCYSPDDTPHWENKLEKCSKLHQAEDDLLEWTIKMSDAHAAVHWITLLQRHGVRGKQRPGIPHPQ